MAILMNMCRHFALGFIDTKLKTYHSAIWKGQRIYRATSWNSLEKISYLKKLSVTLETWVLAWHWLGLQVTLTHDMTLTLTFIMKGNIHIHIKNHTDLNPYRSDHHSHRGDVNGEGMWGMLVVFVTRMSLPNWTLLFHCGSVFPLARANLLPTPSSKRWRCTWWWISICVGAAKVVLRNCCPECGHQTMVGQQGATLQIYVEKGDCEPFQLLFPEFQGEYFGAFVK